MAPAHPIRREPKPGKSSSRAVQNRGAPQRNSGLSLKPEEIGVSGHLLDTKPERIDVPLLMRESEFREFYRNEGGATEQDTAVAKSPGTASPHTTPEEQVDAAHASLTAALRDDLLQRILANIPAFF